MSLSLSALADECRLTLDELRSRLVHHGVGSSGHGDTWEIRVRSLCHEWAKEAGGVIGGGVVVPTYDDDALAGAACTTLQKRLQFVFANLPQDRLTGQEWEDVKATPHRVWLSREPRQAPSGGIEHMGWALHVAIPDDAHPSAKRIIADLPIQFENLDLFACDWDEAPDNS